MKKERNLYRITTESDLEGITERTQWLTEFEVDSFYRRMQKQRLKSAHKLFFRVISIEAINTTA